MALFSRRSVPGSGELFPEDMAGWLSDFGKHQFSPNSCPDPWRRVGELYSLAQADQGSFLRQLAAISMRDGQWVAVGAKRLAIEIFPDDIGRAGFSQIVAAGLRFQRDSGIGVMSMREKDLWSRVKGAEEG